MDKSKRKRRFHILCFLGFFCVTVILTGCEPLRKKFIREKRRDAVVRDDPILDPIDYPARAYDAKGDYTYRYSLFHVWKKEFTSGIDDQTTPKRLRFLMDSMIGQLDEMGKILTEKKRSELGEDVKELYQIRDQLERPSQFYNMSAMKKKVNSITQVIRSKYKPAAMESHIR